MDKFSWFKWRLFLIIADFPILNHNFLLSQADNNNIGINVDISYYEVDLFLTTVLKRFKITTEYT